MDRSHLSGKRQSEIPAIWIALAIYAIGVFVTYSRVEPEELYHVSSDGLDGGFSRLLVWLSFPVGLISIPITLAVWSRLNEAGLRKRFVDAVSVLSIALISTFPLFVDEADLDARPANAIAAIGVALSVALSVYGIRKLGMDWVAKSRRWNRVSLNVIVVLLLLSPPWILATWGIYSEDVPVLDYIFFSVEPGVDGPETVMVHLGDHHGTHGAAFAIAAIVLMRLAGTLRGRRLDLLFTAYVSLLFVYGVANAAQDFSLEQIVKRGWADNELPSMLNPELSLAWLVMLIAAAVIFAWLIGLSPPVDQEAAGNEPPLLLPD